MGTTLSPSSGTREWERVPPVGGVDRLEEHGAQTIQGRRIVAVQPRVARVTVVVGGGLRVCRYFSSLEAPSTVVARYGPPLCDGCRQGPARDPAVDYQNTYFFTGVTRRRYPPNESGRGPGPRNMYRLFVRGTSTTRDRPDSNGCYHRPWPCHRPCPHCHYN